MRVSDFSSHFQSMGLTELRPPWPAGAFLAAPIRHQREDVGNIYLAREPDEPAFTREDEETLVLFASQAALVIANARRYRDEQRARARLETLIDTSPVGVAVFHARDGSADLLQPGDEKDPRKRVESGPVAAGIPRKPDTDGAPTEGRYPSRICPWPRH